MPSLSSFPQSNLERATRELTLNLVAMPSVNATSGETSIIEYLHHRLTRNPAYQTGRLRLFLIPCEDDALFRPLLIAHMPGRTSAGVLLFGHTDTVGTSDYAALESLAFRPTELTEAIASGALGPEQAVRAKSGKWLFGRGILDMKSGVAAALTAFEALAEQAPDAHLFFAATPDEEVSSLGIKTLSRWLDTYTRTHDIHLTAAINTDYTSAFPGDGGKRHIYLGSIGKTLPAVYVRGAASHAAEPENGVDPNLILAAITQRIVYNQGLCDVVEVEPGFVERCPPPVCLYQRDDKAFYDVQTAVSATAYYNLFHMTRSPKKQLALFTTEVTAAVAQISAQHPNYCSVPIPVMTYAQLLAAADNVTRADILSYEQSLTLSKDLRERSRLIVEILLQRVGIHGPCVVVYYAAGLIPEVASGEQLRIPLKKGLAEFSETYREYFALHRYFPYISDLSFLTTSPDWQDDSFAQNFPCQSTVTPRPTRNVPTLMIGTYGVGAHQPHESIDVAYTFGRLPLLLYQLVTQFGAMPSTK